MRPASRHGEDRAAADRDIRGKPGTSGCLTGNGRTADLQICYRTWLTLLLTDVELCDSQSGRTPLSRYGGPRSRSRTQSSRLLASASPISIPTSCPCSTRRSLHGNQPQVWASVRGGHAGCVHPAGPGATGPPPAFSDAPLLSSHQCKHHTRTAGFLRDTLAPEHWEGKQRPPWEQTGSPTRARPHAQSTQGPCPSCVCPGSLLRLRAFPRATRGLCQSSVVQTPARCCTCPGNAGLKTL